VQVDFVDETEAVASGYNGSTALTSRDNSTSALSAQLTSLPVVEHSSAVVYPPRNRTLSSSSRPSLATSSTSIDTNPQTSDICRSETLSSSRVRNVPNIESDTASTSQQPRAKETASSTPPETIVSSVPTKPLEGYEQAYLMRVFADQWGPGVSWIITYPVISTN
jgi:hypothetical protein